MARRKRNNRDDPWWVTPLVIASAAGVGVGIVTWVRRGTASAATPPPEPPMPTLVPTPRRTAAPPVVSTMPTMPQTGFAASLTGLSQSAYLRAVEAAVLAGNVPASLGVFVPVTVAANGRTGRFWASPMPLSVGTDADPFHAPMPATMAQRLADHFGASLPTRKMIDAIHAAAQTHVAFRSFGSPRDTVPTFQASSAGIEPRRAGRMGLVSDYGKDYVLSTWRRNTPGKIAIYGAWGSTTGSPVQPLAVPHSLSYFDYSQHARLIAQHVEVDGVTMSLADALANPATAPLFSDEGPITGAMLRYPTA